MHTEISIVDARPRPLAAVRVTTRLADWPKEFRHSLDKVYQAVKAGRIQKGGHNVMVYYPREDGLTDIECGIETGGRFEPAGEIVYCETPSGMTATAAHIGPYNRLGVTHNAIVTWSRNNGYNVSGVCWEIYGDGKRIRRNCGPICSIRCSDRRELGEGQSRLVRPAHAGRSDTLRLRERGRKLRISGDRPIAGAFIAGRSPPKTPLLRFKPRNWPKFLIFELLIKTTGIRSPAVTLM